MAAPAATIHLPPQLNAAILPQAVQDELNAILVDNNWAIEIRDNEPNKHPKSWQQNPTTNTLLPAQAINPTMVVYQLEKVYSQSRWYFRRTGYFGFLHPITREFIGTTFLHYLQIKFLFSTILVHLKKYHLPYGNRFAGKHIMIPKRHLYYLWQKKFQYHTDSQAAFRKIFRLFLRVVNLPMCAMRIVPSPTGVMCMPAKIVRGNDPEQDCMNFIFPIDEEWACRLYNVAVPDYMGTLDIVPHQVPGSTNNASNEVSHTLLIEKKCIFNKFFANDFHRENNCVVMTGSGFPDVNSIAFVKFMELSIGSQVQGLCDNNPFGVLLLKSYQHTKYELALHNMLKTDVGWLGWNPAFGNAFPQVHQTAGYSVTDERVLDHLLDTRNQFVLHQGHNKPKYANAARTAFRQNQMQIMRQTRGKCNLDDIPTQPLLTAVRFIFGQGRNAYEGKF